jgi:hypothetical protein
MLVLFKLYSKYNYYSTIGNAFPKLFLLKSVETPQDLGITGRRILDPEYSHRVETTPLAAR